MRTLNFKKKILKKAESLNIKPTLIGLIQSHAHRAERVIKYVPGAFAYLSKVERIIIRIIFTQSTITRMKQRDEGRLISLISLHVTLQFHETF